MMERGDQLRFLCLVMSMSIGVMYSFGLFSEPPNTPNRRSHMRQVTQVQDKREVQETREVSDVRETRGEAKVNKTEDVKHPATITEKVPLLDLLSANENIKNS
ncbi:unnamed protein product [Chrysodeixis includens]|uniref:Uncharacterized protein n=1 Tax=Chrysodeixis includens TaxID=689277 RepID=A0A9P0FXE6_CHRIL|nr:unnamed protein product [Chrysodeixis includens]